MTALAIFFVVCSGAAAGEVGHLAVLPDGRRLHVACEGAGAPTILLESGLGLPMAVWAKVMPGLASQTRVCAYDRAGYGSSDPGPLPRDAKHVAADLAALAHAEKLTPPYVLVGHSLGADYVRLFAAEHRRDVVGIVLVEPIFPEAKLEAASQAAKDALAADNLTTERCVGALASGRPWKAENPDYALCGPPPPEGSAQAFRPMAQATFSEFENREASNAEAAAIGRLTAPMIVLTAQGKRGPLAGAQDVFVSEHKAIAATSTRGVQRTVENSDHLMQFDEPEAVVQAVNDVIAGAAKAPN